MAVAEFNIKNELHFTYLTHEWIPIRLTPSMIEGWREFQKLGSDIVHLSLSLSLPLSSHSGSRTTKKTRIPLNASLLPSFHACTLLSKSPIPKSPKHIPHRPIQSMICVPPNANYLTKKSKQAINDEFERKKTNNLGKESKQACRWTWNAIKRFERHPAMHVCTCIQVNK